MKKLALASVAFAGVTAFGAGDSFAVGFFGYTSQSSFGSSTDTTVWSPVGKSSSVGAGSTASVQQFSGIKHIGVTASFGTTSGSFTSPTLTVFNQNCGGGINQICAGFKPNTHVLGDNSFEGTGTISLGFTQHLSALGFQLSPLGSDWDAHATFYTGPSNAYVLLGTVSIVGHALCSGTTTTHQPASCATPVFFGAKDTTPITAATVSLSSAGSMGIGTLYETLATTPKIPEPTTLSLLGAGLLGLGALRRRRRGRDRMDGSRWSPFGRWRVVDSPPDTKHLLR